MFWNKKGKEKQTDVVTLTDTNFDEYVKDQPLPLLIDFWAPWCGPCKAMNPIIDELSTEFKERVIIGKVNVDQNPMLSQYFKVKSIPTLFFVKNGQLIERFSQMIPKPNLEEMLEDLIALEVPDLPPPSTEEE